MLMSRIICRVNTICTVLPRVLLSGGPFQPLKFVKPFQPQVLKEIGPNFKRNNTLPRDYELIMQKVMMRIGPSSLGRKKLHKILLTKRENKYSEAVRMSKPSGRLTMHGQLIRGKRTLWNHDW